MSTKTPYSPSSIRRDLFIDDVPVHTKFGVVHGGKGSSAEAVRLSVTAYMNGEVEKLILVGGARVFDPKTLTGIWQFNSDYFKDDGLKGVFHKAGEFLSFRRESILMRQIALSEGVPEKDILTEGIDFGGKPSKHTGANVDSVLSSGDLRRDIIGEGSLKIFGLVYNTRRQCGVWQKKLEGFDDGDRVVIVPRSFYPYGFTPDNWSSSNLIKKGVVFPEMRKIDPDDSKRCHLYITNDYKTFDEVKHRDLAIENLRTLNSPLPQYS